MAKETFQQKKDRFLKQLEIDIKNPSTTNIIRLIFADSKTKNQEESNA